MPLPNIDRAESLAHHLPNVKKEKADKRIGFIKGIVLSLVLAMLAGSIAKIPFFSIMGIMIISIILGMIWKALIEVPANINVGITFSSNILLRTGIILMGLRLNFTQIIEAGFSIVFISRSGFSHAPGRLFVSACFSVPACFPVVVITRSPAPVVP